MSATEQTGMMGMEMRKQREKKTLSKGRNNKQTDGCKQKEGGRGGGGGRGK